MGDAIQTIQIRFTGDKRALDKSFDEIDNSVRKMGGNITDISKDINLLNGKIEETNVLTTKYNSSAKTAAEATEMQRQTLQKYGAVVENVSSSEQRAFENQRLQIGNVLAYSLAYGAAAAAIIGVNNAISSLIERGQNLQSTEAVFTTAFKDAALIADQLEFVGEVAEEFALDIGQLRLEYSKFATASTFAGTSIADTETIFSNMSKATRVLGMSVDDTHATFIALSQMMNKGKILSEELQNQLGERIPGAMALMAKSIQKTIPELRAMMEQGELTSEALVGFSEVVAESMSDKALSQARESLKGQTALMLTEWDKFATTLFEKVEPSLIATTQNLAALMRLLTELENPLFLFSSAFTVAVVVIGLKLVYALNRGIERLIIMAKESTKTALTTAKLAKGQKKLRLDLKATNDEYERNIKLLKQANLYNKKNAAELKNIRNTEDELTRSVDRTTESLTRKEQNLAKLSNSLGGATGLIAILTAGVYALINAWQQEAIARADVSSGVKKANAARVEFLALKSKFMKEEEDTNNKLQAQMEVQVNLAKKEANLIARRVNAWNKERRERGWWHIKLLDFIQQESAQLGELVGKYDLVVNSIHRMNAELRHLDSSKAIANQIASTEDFVKELAKIDLARESIGLDATEKKMLALEREGVIKGEELEILQEQLDLLRQEQEEYDTFLDKIKEEDRQKKANEKARIKAAEKIAKIKARAADETFKATMEQNMADRKLTGVQAELYKVQIEEALKLRQIKRLDATTAEKQALIEEARNQSYLKQSKVLADANNKITRKREEELKELAAELRDVNHEVATLRRSLEGLPPIKITDTAKMFEQTIDQVSFLKDTLAELKEQKNAVGKTAVELLEYKLTVIGVDKALAKLILTTYASNEAEKTKVEYLKTVNEELETQIRELGRTEEGLLRYEIALHNLNAEEEATIRQKKAIVELLQQEKDLRERAKNLFETPAVKEAEERGKDVKALDLAAQEAGAAGDIELQKEIYAIKEDMEWQHNLAMAEMRSEAAGAQYEMATRQIKHYTDQGANLSKSMVTILTGLGSEGSTLNKRFFQMAKRFAMAQTAIDLGSGLSKAVGLGFPLMIPAIAAVVAQSVSAIAEIKGADYVGGFAQGGTIDVKGNSGIDNNRIIMDVSRGEQIQVLTPAQQQQPTGMVNITIENSIPAAHFTLKRLSETDVRLIARQEVAAESGNTIAKELHNPNSRVSKAVTRNNTTSRRRV